MVEKFTYQISDMFPENYDLNFGIFVISNQMTGVEETKEDDRWKERTYIFVGIF